MQEARTIGVEADLVLGRSVVYSYDHHEYYHIFIIHYTIFFDVCIYSFGKKIELRKIKIYKNFGNDIEQLEEQP